MAQSPARTALRGTAVLVIATFVCCLVWLLAGTPARRLVVLLADGGPSALSRTTLDEVLTGLCSIALLGSAGWLFSVTTVLVGQAVGATDWAPPRLCPRLLRRLVLAGCGVALTSTLVPPAFADPSEATDPAATSVQSQLSGLTLPDRAMGRPPNHRPPVKHESVVVTPGDSLWAIARSSLGESADDADVAAATRALYLANLERIGDDPDLIFPGTTLHLPSPRPDRKDPR